MERVCSSYAYAYAYAHDANAYAYAYTVGDFSLAFWLIMLMHVLMG